MRIPVVHGLIDRRLLVNYRVDPQVLAQVLPQPFRPQIVHGVGIAGICLIRLKQIRPRLVPRFMGMASENAAHRIAVEWEQGGQVHQGVYVPRRDTNSRINALLGGRMFPGVHHHAAFEIHETDDRYRVEVTSDDGEVSLHVDGSVAEALPGGSVFDSVAEVSDFFEKDSLGYSATRKADKFDGLELHSHNWSVIPLQVHAVRSSFFEDVESFPVGSVEFDHALLMREIHHEWRGQAILTAEACACVTG